MTVHQAECGAGGLEFVCRGNRTLLHSKRTFLDGTLALADVRLAGAVSKLAKQTCHHRGEVQRLMKSDQIRSE